MRGGSPRQDCLRIWSSCGTERYANSGVYQFVPDEVLHHRMSFVESECRLERSRLIWETMASKVDPFVLAKLLNNPRSARPFSLYVREYGEVTDTLTNIDQFRIHGEEFILASLTNSNEMFSSSRRIRRIGSSSTNESGQRWGVGWDVEIREINMLTLPVWTSSKWWQHSELAGGTPLDAQLKWMGCLEEINNERNDLIPEFA